MNPKYRGAVLVGTMFAIMAPYVGFVMYCALRFPSGQWPTWSTNTLAIWFAANFLIVILVQRLLSKKVFKSHTVDPEKASRALARSRSLSLRLIIVWTGFFIYGVVELVQGKLPIGRAIPAGAFLLFFIGLFGWSLYQSRRKDT